MSGNLFDEKTGELRIKKREKYQVKTKEFEGPIDLLLYLVKNSEINIYDISIADITQQYLEYLSLLVEHDLDNISDFIEMASTLIYIKSKTLLPVEINYIEEEEELREELITKLLEYQKFKMAANVLEERVDTSHFLPRKTTESNLFNVEDDEESNWIQISIIELVSAFASVLNDKNKRENDYEIVQLEFTVSDKIEEITRQLQERESFNFFEIVNNSMPKMELVCSFLAILEMVKQGKISLKQHKIFGDIHIVRKNIQK